MEVYLLDLLLVAIIEMKIQARIRVNSDLQDANVSYFH